MSLENLYSTRFLCKHLAHNYIFILIRNVNVVETRHCRNRKDDVSIY